MTSHEHCFRISIHMQTRHTTSNLHLHSLSSRAPFVNGINGTQQQPPMPSPHHPLKLLLLSHLPQTSLLAHVYFHLLTLSPRFLQLLYPYSRTFVHYHQLSRVLIEMARLENQWAEGEKWTHKSPSINPAVSLGTNGFPPLLNCLHETPPGPLLYLSIFLCKSSKILAEGNDSSPIIPSRPSVVA